MTDEAKPTTPVAGETQIEGMIGFFEKQMQLLGKAFDGLQEDTRSAFQEVHETVDLGKRRNSAVRSANARFRAFLGHSNDPPLELKALESEK